MSEALKVYKFSTKQEVDTLSVDLTDILSVVIDDNFLSMYFSRMKSYHLNERHAKVKNQSEISGTTAKPYKQKGTGNARQGTKRAVQHRGGASIFGPRGTTFKVSIPKKEVKLAKKMLLSLALQQGKLFVVEDVKILDHKTKNTVNAVSNYVDTNANVVQKVLILHNDEIDKNNLISSANVSNVRYSKVKTFTVIDLWESDAVVITKSALTELLNLL